MHTCMCVYAYVAVSVSYMWLSLVKVIPYLAPPWKDELLECIFFKFMNTCTYVRGGWVGGMGAKEIFGCFDNVYLIVVVVVFFFFRVFFLFPFVSSLVSFFFFCSLCFFFFCFLPFLDFFSSFSLEYR